MKLKKARLYKMTNRASAAEKSSEGIIKALGELWLKHSIHEITLGKIAEKAGVTVRTILRKFGSKEGLLMAALQSDPAGIRAIKDEAKAGDIDHIVSILMKEYEYSGLAAIRTLAVENEIPIAGKILKKGRHFHKSWCSRVFAPFLPKINDKKYPLMLGAFYAATDVNKWKLLRLDLGYTKGQTEEIFRIMLLSLINANNK